MERLDGSVTLGSGPEFGPCPLQLSAECLGSRAGGLIRGKKRTEEKNKKNKKVIIFFHSTV